jgi:adenylate kinase
MYDDKQIDAIKNWIGAGSINIFGRPFAGKDAQGKRLAELLGGNLVGGGEILRGSKIPEQAKQNMSTGKLIPTDDYINIVLPYLKQPSLANKPLILSSVGRWHGEEDGVIQSLEESNHALKAVIYLDISNNESHSRWLAREINNDRTSRHDDTEEILNIRFDEFRDKTLPVIDTYRNLGLIIDINGNRTRNEVTQDIINALSERAKAGRA